MHPLIGRLKQRKIVQWALAYSAGAVALYSALEAFAEPWGVGARQLRMVQVVLLVGFFLALTLAWYHGERGEQKVSGAELLILAGIMGLGAIGLRLTATGPSVITPTNEPVYRNRVDLAPNHLPLGSFELGPDEAGVVYSVVRNGPRWYRSWAELEGRPISGSEGGAYDLSGDGALLVEISQGELRVIPIRGTGVQRRSVGSGSRGPTWGGDGFIYFTGPTGTLQRVSESLQGEIEPLGLELESDELRHHSFRVLPGGRGGVLQADASTPKIIGFDFATGRRVLLAHGISPRPTRTGHVLFGTPEGEIMAATLDPRTLQLGQVVAIVPGKQLVDRAEMVWSISADGTLGYWEGEPRHELVWVARDGAVTPVAAGWSFDAGDDSHGWALSTAGEHIAFRAVVNGRGNIFVKDIATGSETQLTDVAAGEEALYPSFLSDTAVIYTRRVVAASDFSVEVVSLGTGELLPLRWGGGPGVVRAVVDPTAQRLVARTSGDADLIGFSLEEFGPPVEVASARGRIETTPAFSPDGRWVAYTSTEGDLRDVWVSPFPNVRGDRTQVSSSGGESPTWSRDGRELFYVTPDRRMHSRRVVTDPTFRVTSLPEELFHVGDEFSGSPRVTFAHQAPDGRFLMLRRQRSGSVVIVSNFLSELQRLHPN